MNNISQNLSGNNNSQTINNISIGKELTIDLLPDDLNSLLEYLSNNNQKIDDKLPFSKPDLTQKNSLNGIDNSYFTMVEDDYKYFQDIEDILRNDNSKELINKYKIAIRLLNLEYLAKYVGNMKSFICAVVAKHNESTNCSSELSEKLMRLLHYMYTQCDIGVKP